MKRNFRRLFAVIMSVLTVVMAVMPAVGAVSTAANDLPIVYVKGAGREIYSADGHQIMPFDIEPEEQIMNQMDTIAKAFVVSLAAGNWDYYCNTMVNIISKVFKDVVLDKNGEASDGSYIIPSPAPTKKTSNFYLSNYVFNYDSRLDPWEVAEQLDDYIDQVLKATGKKKVQIVSRCLGGNYAAAYLSRYGAEKVDTCIFYVASTKGTVVCSESFSGSFRFDADLINDYVENNMGDDSDLAGLIKSVVSMTYSLSALHIGANAVESIYKQIANQLVPKMLLASYATMPAYWSMVDDENFEKAKRFIFGDDIGQYSGLIDKIDNYHYNVMNTFEETMLQLQSEGLKIGIIGKYNIALPPVFQSSEEQADGTIELDYQTFGATAANIGKTLSRDYLNSLKGTGAMDYVSPDLVVDASTCIFPDYTWFIKDSEHTDFSAAINKLIYAILGSRSQFTIKSDKNFPQYMRYNAATKTLSPVTKADANGSTGNEGVNFIERIIAAFNKIILFFKSIFGIVN